MDYERLYLRFCSAFKKSNPRERLYSRNKNDKRLFLDKIYTEYHHILPKSLGGTDEEVNLVEVLPEEHLFLHKLRYKAYRKREDFLAIRFILNGFKSKKHKIISDDSEKKFKNIYGWFRQNCYKFRNKVGWQTQEGIKSISEYRRGKIPGKCSKTGKILGEFDINDPRVLSGEIVHHSKGKHKYINPDTGEQIFCSVNEKPYGFKAVCGDIKGDKNPKFSGITDDEIFQFSKKLALYLKQKYSETELPSLKFISKIWNIIYPDRKFPSLCGGLRSGFRFKGDLYENLFQPLSKELNLDYSKYTKIGLRYDIFQIAEEFKCLK